MGTKLIFGSCSGQMKAFRDPPPSGRLLAMAVFQAGFEAEFSVLPEAAFPLIATSGYDYDYASIMHLSGQQHSRSDDDVITTVDPFLQRTIGQRVELSFADTHALNQLYCGE